MSTETNAKEINAERLAFEDMKDDIDFHGVLITDCCHIDDIEGNDKLILFYENHHIRSHKTKSAYKKTA